jgi:phytoene dehydrogenase-like protein
MTQDARKIVIIGAGIAGLCAAVYARRCGYEVELIEKHNAAGGLATSWRRGDYTFETCLHWLLGSNPDSAMYSRWAEVFDIGKLTFVNPEEFVRLETEHGERLRIYANLDRLESELLENAPQDTAEISRFVSAARRLASLELPDPTEGWPHSWLTLVRTLPYFSVLRYWSNLSSKEYGQRFTHPLLRSFFGGGETGEMSALALVFSLAWMSQHNAGYAIGGSQAIIRLIVDKLLSLGGRLRLGANVEKILVKRDTAVGVQLASGETIAADWVISAADGHATVYDLLGGRYRDKITDETYSTRQTFPSYLQVSLGVARDLSQQAGYVTRLLDTPLKVDPHTQLRQISFRFFHFDPTFAPLGKTAVTCFLPTYNFEYWVDLQRRDSAQYHAEKHRVAETAIAILARSIPDIRQAIEVIDVSTPATVIRYTGNWKGSMEGWLLTPGTGFRPLQMALPGLRNFLMVGQWVMPGGGLPTGLMTARSAIQAVCKQDRVVFATAVLAGDKSRRPLGHATPPVTLKNLVE